MRHRVVFVAVCTVLLCACGFAGLNQQDGGSFVPGDATSAIGPDRFIELVNSAFEIFDRNGNTIAKGTSGQLFGTGNAFISDPQIVWDAPSQRFYISSVANLGSSRFPDWGLVYGFSRASSPSDASTWCTYFLDANYRSQLPDFPRLGLSQDFALIGANRFTNSIAVKVRGHGPHPKTTGAAGSSFLGADVSWIAKPPNGALASCPALGNNGIFRTLFTANGNPAATPVPTREVDANATAYIVANGDPLPATSISLYTVTNSGGNAVLSAPTNITVASYNDPPGPAPQAGGNPLDVGDSRFTSAWMAFDPNFGHDDIWIAHSVAGGAGTMVRWYEIAPATAAVDQQGVISDPNLDVYYPAISPDRAPGEFGSNMAIALTTSSSSQPTAVAVVQKEGLSTAAPLTIVQASKTAWSCTIQQGFGACRWGDYLGASPDPNPPNKGQVWLTGEWNTSTLWQTWNWSTVP